MDNNPPSMNEHEISAISACLRSFTKRANVLEWCSRNSTAYFSRFVTPDSSWHAVEHDRDWVQKIRRQAGASPTCRLTVRHVPNNGAFRDGIDDGDITSFRDYVTSPGAARSFFDIILVDGRARVDCMREGWRLLSADGVMILHDAQRQEYRPGIPGDAFTVRITNPALDAGEGPISVLFMFRGDAAARKLAAELTALLPAPIVVECAAPRPDVTAKIDARGSCVFVNTYYPAYLSAHYARYPALAQAPYREQLDALQADRFGDSDFYSAGMTAAGWAADDLIVNCSPLQEAWARERASDAQGLAVAVEQIRRAQPDVVYLQDLGLATGEFISAIRPLTGLIVGQIASPVPPQARVQDLDIIVSSFPHFVERFRAQGITAYYQPLAFDPRVGQAVPEGTRDLPVTFVGGISAAHRQGLALLEQLAVATPIEFWGYGGDALAEDSPVRQRHHGEAWGRGMFSLLCRSKITIDRHIDVAENFANNMRLFEATGCGALLITDYKDNLADLFDIGTEVVAYRSPEECAALIGYYLAHPAAAEKIARAGQRRTLAEHTYGRRMAQTAEILSRHLRYRSERATHAAVDISGVSTGHTSIDKSSVTRSMLTAWKSDRIPRMQRALVQDELNRMYHGQMIDVFGVLTEAVRRLAPGGASVLDVGCASGYYAEVLEYVLCRPLTYCGIDYSQPLLSLARDYYPRMRLAAADGAALPFGDGAFPIVISSGILLHVTNYAEHIAESARVAKEYVIAHRTPVCRVSATQYVKKLAYGVETVELVFNENELVSLFSKNGMSLLTHCEYAGSPSDDYFEVTFVFRMLARAAVSRAPTLPAQRPQPAEPSDRLTWDMIASMPSIKLYAGDVPDREEYAGLIGLSITRKRDRRHIDHDLRRPLPLPDNSVDSLLSEDVFEHIDRESIPPIVEEIYRVLKPGGLFRLSVPDYRCDVLRDRCEKDAQGRPVFDPGGEGTREKPFHRWLPVIESVSDILDKSSFARDGSIDYLHYYRSDGSFVLKPIDHAKGHIDRTPDFDPRVQSPRRPMSMVIDLIKGTSRASGVAASAASASAAPAAPVVAPRKNAVVCQFRAGPVVLVSRDIAFVFPLSYAYLAGYLRSQGEQVTVLFKDTDRVTLVNNIMSLNPVLVGFGNLYPELKETGELIRMLNRAGRRFPVVIGGQMVSPTPKFSVEITGADYGVIGEGEITLYKLVTALRQGADPLSVKGLAIRQGADVTLTGPGEFIEDLDTLPPVPYDLFPLDRWLPIGQWYARNCPVPHWKVEDRVINVHGGRGCPFRCNFCYHHSRPRYRSLPVMFAEAAEALERFDGNMLYFSDDLVLSSPARAAKLVAEVRGLKRRINFSVSTRFDLLARMDDALLGEMKDAGCRIMGLGIESGSDRILKIIGKNCTAEVILTQLARLKRFGILPTVSIMVGQHTETIEDAEASLALVKESVRENPLLQYAFTIMTPFPGSPLYDLIFKQGLLKDDREFYDRYFASSGEWKQIVNLSAMTPEQVVAMQQRMEREFLLAKQAEQGRR